MPHIFTGRMPFLPPNQQRQSTERTQDSSKHTTHFHSSTKQQQPGTGWYTHWLCEMSMVVAGGLDTWTAMYDTIGNVYAFTVQNRNMKNNEKRTEKNQLAQKIRAEFLSVKTLLREERSLKWKVFVK